MNVRGFSFELHHTDANSSARCSTLHTPRGPVALPAFMPVGTQATVKGLTASQVRATGAEIVLANTYHLALRPGADVVASYGGLHRFMDWEDPILTDSGGFQLFSLAQRTKIKEQGATFQSHIDGSLLDLTPERALEIQAKLGSDIAMVLDHVVALPNEPSVVEDAMQRTIRWARRSRDAAWRDGMAVFAIVQGGLDASLRLQCTEQLVAMDFPGYAVGGLSVGEPPLDMYRMLDVTCLALPADRPRYLMGVGRPEDLLEAVRRGVDMFDCVMPTRNGRNALAFTDQGTIRLRNQKFERDDRPLDEATPSEASRYSRGYIRHLFKADEMLGPILLSIHNLAYYQRLLADARIAIVEDRFEAFCESKFAGWSSGQDEPV
ncbi:MAG: tRNA guanosine(34) transglycosylase Tgt [Pirellulales bacterium]|nr:tRNA guanosine(34) transglycosylase Tgt [Pirellulales bacterium]